MDKNYKNDKIQDKEEALTLRGKTPEEVNHYLLSGESDDLSFEYFDD